MPGYENSAGLNVNNQYGPRRTGNSVGVERTSNSVEVLSFAFTGRSLNETFVPPVVMPRGALVLRYRLRIDEAFTLTGTTPGLVIGGTAPATNGVALTQAELQAIGTKTPASSGTGTWATGSATGATAAEKVTKALTGTTPVVDPTVGKGTLFVEYYFDTKV